MRELYTSGFAALLRLRKSELLAGKLILNCRKTRARRGEVSSFCCTFKIVPRDELGLLGNLVVERIKTLELYLEPERRITAAFDAMERPITEKFAAIDK